MNFRELSLFSIDAGIKAAMPRARDVMEFREKGKGVF